MNRLKRWVMGTLTVDDLVIYFHEIGISFDFKLNKKKLPEYYMNDSRIYRLRKK